MEPNTLPPPPPPPNSWMSSEDSYQPYAYQAAAYAIWNGAAITTTSPAAAQLTNGATDDTEPANAADTEFRRIVLSTAAKLESARNHQTELEAWTLFASSQLSQHNSTAATVAGGVTTVVNTTDLPLSITDAWQAIAVAATKPAFDDVAVDINSREKTVSASVTTATIAGLVDPTTQEERIVTVPAGQQSVAVRKLVMSNSLKRMAVMADETIQQRKEVASGVLPQLMQEYQKQLQLNPHIANGSTAAYPWLQLLDTRLHELRKYHAEYDHHEIELLHSTNGTEQPTVGTSISSGLQQQQQQQQQQHLYSNPVVDGYDMVGTIKGWTSSLDVVLSTEEVMGKYLDLHPHFEYFTQHLSDLKSDNNIKSSTNENYNPNGKRTLSSSVSYQYIDFLEDLSKGIGRIWSEEQKLLKRRKYARFVIELQQYLESFLDRTVPLIKIGNIIDSVTDEFRTFWSRTGGSPGWHEKIGEAVLATTIGTNIESNDTNDDKKDEMVLKIDLGLYDSAQDLAAKVDGDTLKAELSRLGLKCGGTVQDRATRLYLLKNKKLEELPQKLFVKKANTNVTKGASTNVQKDLSIQADTIQHAKNERRIDIAYREAIVTALLGQLGPTLEATIRRAERRQTQTLKEREREMDEELYGSGVVTVKEKKDDGEDDSSDEDDAPIYNPKNVPLDFDGKPIPYWLFKLHGLNHYYPCEICGGEAYRGRRNFELHFGEQKHTAGMRSLGIPNTKHFHGVTKIDDAQILWHSLQEKLQQNKFDERNDEEYEDSHGNVLSRSLYEDLARQNLL
jgi:SF3a60/Prp9 C-terminal/Replication stress response SDE2 C-terminal